MPNNGYPPDLWANIGRVFGFVFHRISIAPYRTLREWLRLSNAE